MEKKKEREIDKNKREWKKLDMEKNKIGNNKNIEKSGGGS